MSVARYLLVRKCLMVSFFLLLGSMGVNLFNLTNLEVLSIALWALALLFLVKALLLFLVLA